ncbi:uncharacterized protein LOC132738810 [Ruditapes philippinarum]|uniref:uncharacterized protein LOC132738810 n=1 Tax=Ruditapes philippinarum TaxID=129788 RepID=UPI00295AE1D3|nr:uncharacterized protein LOC132738810 [Ruditapes philippinarum]
MMRLTRHRYRNGARSSSPRIPSKESSASSNNSDVNASHSSSTGSINSHKVLPIKIGRRFRHFRRNSSYMEQYREEYTYQRLNEFRDFSSLPYYDTHACSCRSCACSPKSSDHRWYPNQSHMEKCNVLPTCEKNPCKTTGAPVPKRTPVLKTRPPPPRKKKQPYVAQIPRLGDAPTCIPKLEFFATSLTVNNYNPVRTPPSPAHRSAPNSASSLIMNCRRGTKSPIHVSTSCVYLLNQNLKGLE